MIGPHENKDSYFHFYFDQLESRQRVRYLALFQLRTFHFFFFFMLLHKYCLLVYESHYTANLTKSIKALLDLCLCG